MNSPGTSLPRNAMTVAFVAIWLAGAGLVRA